MATSPTRQMNKRIRALAQATPSATPVLNRVDEDTTEVFIYDSIGGSFWDGNPTEDIVKDIAAIDTPKIVVRINSPGGVVWDGIAIYNALANHSAEVTTQVDGIAASIAATIAMAGSEIVMLTGSQMMVHKPMMVTMGNADDHRKMIELLDSFEDRIVDVFMTRATVTEKEIRAAMQAETWYSPEAAVDAGLATSVGSLAAVENRHNLSAIFDNVPDGLKTEPNIRELERSLRSEGFSQSKSKTIAALAFSDEANQRDVDSPGQSDSDDLQRAGAALTALTESLKS